MMGIQTTQKDLFSYQVDLDRRVRQDNPLRAIREKVDFAWVRADVAHHYGNNGNESVDPEVILKLLFLLFLDNVKSERELMRIVPERLDYLWFLGYGLDDEIPDHSVLTKARVRWGRETFERFFVRTVAQCVELGLVDGRKIYADSSLIDANASNKSFVRTSPELAGALRAAYAVEESKFEIPEERRPHSYAPQNLTSLSLTDPDATMATKELRGTYAIAKPRYKSHRVVDDQCGVVTAVETTPGHIHDGACLLALTEQHHRTTGIGAQTVVGDQHYGTRENIRGLQAQGICTHMKVSHNTSLTTKTGIFHASEFRYESVSDTYLCPANQPLTRRSYDRVQRGWIYRAQATACRTCSLRSKCTTSPMKDYQGRSIVHPEGYELLVKGWAQARSAEAKRDLRHRMSLLEGSFGQASQNHHFKRARWRRLWRQRIQDHLIAAVQNVKKMVAYGPTGAGTAAASLNPSPETGSQTHVGHKTALAELETIIRLFLSAFVPSLRTECRPIALFFNP
jgi:transposase